MKDYYLKRAGQKPALDLMWENGSATEQKEDLLVLKLRESVERLPFLQKEFVWKFYYQGRTYPQVAKELNVTVKAAHKLHHRVKKRLKKELAPYVRLD